MAQRPTADQAQQHLSLAFPAAGAPPAPAAGAFDASCYMAALDSRVLGRMLLTAAATTSTQVVVQENVGRLPDGLVFVADKQYGGKGAQARRGAGWSQDCG